MEPYSIREARELTISIYVEITRIGWRDKWNKKAERETRELWANAWDKCSTEELRRNMFENCLIAARNIFSERG